MTADPADSRTFSARQAADYCGVDDKTIRAWLAAGKITAEKVGGAWHIPADQLAPLRRYSAPSPADPPHPSAGEAAPDSAEVRSGAAESALSAPLLEALHQLEALRRENRDLAGQLGYLQRQVQDQAARLLALEAPRPDPEAVDAHHGAHASNPGASPAERSPQPPPAGRRPWWRFWG